MHLMDLALSILVFVSVSVFVWALLPDMTRRLVRRRLYSEVSDVKRPPPWKVLLEHAVRLLTPLNRRLPTSGYCARMAKTLEAAGSSLPPLHFLVIQELGIVTGLLVYFVTMGFESLSMAWLMGFMGGGFMVPMLWLNNRIHDRRMTITRDLPEVVDLLNLCVGAGSDFMTAMGRIVREFRPCPVVDELNLVLQEVRVGKRRRDALRAFAQRLQTPESSTFARTLIQVDRMGTGLSEALQVLSEDMRMARYHWADRFAQQAPIKMLLPLIMSLGAAMVIVAGPILLQFFRGGLMSGPQMSVAGQVQ